MKNIHILPTDKPSRLYSKDGNHKLDNSTIAMDWYISSVGYKPHHIYITSDKKIKEGDWFYDLGTKYIKIKQSWENSHLDFNGKKIILTTDQDLIKDGVQPIDDEFLQWFVQNPCEKVEVQKWSSLAECGYSYHIIIPKEEPNKTHYLDEIPNTNKEVVLKMFEAAIPKLEPKQETLEEAAERMSKEHYVDQSDYWAVGVDSFKRGAKWQAERMYSEEEVDKLISDFKHDLRESTSNYVKQNCEGAIFGLKRLKQFKKK